MDLNSHPPPVYEAISYSWRRDVLLNRLFVTLSRILPWFFPKEYSVEEASLSRLLVCNGKILRIQPNLYDFLLRLRQQRRRFPLWIDAICINQDETIEQARKEKYSQILLMREIYGSAIRVLVWLGESSNIYKTLPSIIEEIPQLTFHYENFQEENHILRLKNNLSVVEAMVKIFGLDGSLWTILQTAYRRATIYDFFKLANRDYFQRVWVVQELVLARELHFFVGALQFSRETILKGHQIVATLNSQPTLTSSDLQRTGFLALPHIMKSREDHQQGNSWSVDDFLLLLRDRVAARPEDKVFSILGLLDKQVADDLTAGVMYGGKPRLEKVYLNGALAIARERGWPYVLSLVSLGSAECTDLPSWIPDLRKPLHPKPFWYYGSTHLAAATVTDAILPGDFSVVSTDLPETDTGTSATSIGIPLSIQLPLATIDTIVQVGESHSELNETQSMHMQGHIFDLLSQLGLRYAPTGELTLDALFRTLTADVFAQDRSKTKAHLRFEFYMWLATTFSLIETPRIPGSTLILDWTAKKNGLDTRRETPAINGRDLSLQTSVDRFVEMHDSAAYPIAGIFAREETSRPWIPEARNPEGSRVGQEVELWEGDFTIAKLLDYVVRSMNVSMKGVGNAIEQVYRDRRVFRTGKGYLGCGPSDVRLGDVVCLVGGAPTPFAFRRVGQEGGLVARLPVPLAEGLGKVKVVGEAYVHGLMDGKFAERLRGSFAGVTVL